MDHIIKPPTNQAEINLATPVLPENKTEKPIKGFAKAWETIKWCCHKIKLIVLAIPRKFSHSKKASTEQISVKQHSSERNNVTQPGIKQTGAKYPDISLTEQNGFETLDPSDKYYGEDRFVRTLNQFNQQLAGIENVPQSIMGISKQLNACAIARIKQPSDMDPALYIQCNALNVWTEFLCNKCLEHAQQRKELPPDLQNAWNSINSLLELEHSCKDVHEMGEVTRAVALEVFHHLYNSPEMKIEGERTYTKHRFTFQKAFYAAFDETINIIWQHNHNGHVTIKGVTNINNHIVRNTNIVMEALKMTHPSTDDDSTNTLNDEAAKTYVIEPIGTNGDMYLEHEIMIRTLESLKINSPDTTQQSLNQSLHEVITHLNTWRSVSRNISMIPEKALVGKKLEEIMTTLKPLMNRYFKPRDSNS